ncbi:MAG: diadenylate cyclase CdaA [Mangrovibacterium sp.]
MTSLFISIRFFDLLDIFLVACLLYYMYKLIKGTVAFNIFIGLFLLAVSWVVIKSLHMELMENILGQFLGVGVIALIIVFQQEIRRFLLLLGSHERMQRFFSTDKLFKREEDDRLVTNRQIRMLVDACLNMGQTKTGALIVIGKGTMLGDIIKTGEVLNARISDSLIETVFFKNSPLHDGAMIIIGNRIAAARCILPVTKRHNINPNLGLRHRAAIGITEESDAIAIIVSEERGKISFCQGGELKLDINGLKLTTILEEVMHTNNKDEKQEEKS